MTPETFDIGITSATTIAPSVQAFVFERLDGRPLLFEPGQWLNLILPLPAGEIRRAYSIASAPDGTPRFELAVTEVQDGPGSGFLCGLGPGARLRAVGPQGFFTRGALDPHPSLLVATGTGVTPLRSMLNAALAAGSTTPMWLLLGVRHVEDILYREEFEGLARSHPGVRVDFTLSQGGDAWSGRTGYVQRHVPELFAELARTSQAEPHVYVCGLERMVTAVRQLARKEMGLPRERVHGERYD
jgi:CDP-4-dehydro-6-deoxyglucose reductase